MMIVNVTSRSSLSRSFQKATREGNEKIKRKDFFTLSELLQGKTLLRHLLNSNVFVFSYSFSINNKDHTI